MNPMDLLTQVLNKSVSPEDFWKHLWRVSNGMKRCARVYTGYPNDPIRLFRTRIFPKGILPKSIAELGYPPVAIAKIGRASATGEPVFYASAGAPTTFVETRCNISDIAVVSEYRICSKLVVQPIGMANDLEVGSEYEFLLNKIFTAVGDEFYSYSSVVAKHLMGGSDIHGLIYPSLMGKNRSENFALKTSYFDSQIQFAHATAFLIKDVTDPWKYSVEEIDFGTSVGCKIDWKGRKKQWKLRTQNQCLAMKSNGWDWDAFDENGKLVDPE